MKIFLSILSFFSSVVACGQDISITDVRNIHSAITIYLAKQEKMDGGSRKSEFIICFLDIDKEGKVKQISLLGDEKNRDLTYDFLNRMPGSVFTSVKLPKCANKTIMVPIISSGEDDAEYVTKLKERYSSEKRVIVEKESGNLLTIAPVQYSIPRSSHKATATSEF